MKNFAKIAATVSLAAAFSFAQYVEYEDNEPWPTSEEQENAQEEPSVAESEQNSTEEDIESKAKEVATKDTVQKSEEDDAVSRVLAQKRARDAARKEEERQKALRGESEMSAIDQTTQPSRAQKATAGIGIRADFNIGNFWGTEDLEDGVEEPGGYGFDIGVTAHFEILDILWFTPEILFEAYWLEQEEEAFTRQFNQMGITIPLMFRAIFPFCTRIYFELGPQISLNLSNEVSFDEDQSKLHVPGSDIVVDNTFEEPEIEQSIFAAGVAIGLGFYIVPDRLALDVRFYAGLTELFPDATSPLSDRDDEKIMVGTKLYSIKFGLNFWFL